MPLFPINITVLCVTRRGIPTRNLNGKLERRVERLVFRVFFRCFFFLIEKTSEIFTELYNNGRAGGNTLRSRCSSRYRWVAFLFTRLLHLDQVGKTGEFSFFPHKRTNGTGKRRDETSPPSVPHKNTTRGFVHELYDRKDKTLVV